MCGRCILKLALGRRGMPGVWHLCEENLALQVVEELLRAGPALNAIDADGCTALHLAAQDGHLEVSRPCVKAVPQER